MQPAPDAAARQTPGTSQSLGQYLPLPPLVPPPATIVRGRPRFFDKARYKEVCTLVAAGCGIDGAARHLGCVPKTIRREARRNPMFGADLRQALKKAELNPLNALQAAATRHWRAAAWLLERTNPKQFARQEADVIPLELFHAFLEKMSSEIVWHLRMQSTYVPLLRKIRRIAKKTQREANLRRELPPLLKPPGKTATQTSSAAFAADQRSTTNHATDAQNVHLMP